MNWGLPISICLVFTAALGAAEPKLWSLERLQKPAAPAVSEWGRTPVDGFIIAKLQAANLSPQPEADRHTLIRRLTLGLTGLPPTVAEMEQFVWDTKPGAYERLVDRLLAKPAFGERWGRHWLDVVRFGESSGELTVNDDKPRSNAWRFRDAVIRALNEDVPFDQFVRFHFVPDEKNKELGQFIHLGTRLQDNANPNDKQFHRLDDMVATTGVAFLGISFGCARCHDHPVDPMSTEEYYQLTAMFWDQVKETPKAKRKTIPLEINEPRVLGKGSWRSPKQPVQPGFLKVLNRRDDAEWLHGNNKLAALGNWLTNPEHGAGELLARVIVNRLWHHHFGQGLVRTPNDFGNLGTRPTHPQLLDWLANRLIEKKWSTKQLIREVILSQTYQMSSKPVNAASEAKDPANILLHRMPVRRLQGEAIRDAILAVSGRLDKKMYGAPVAVHLTTFMEGRGRPGRSGPLDGAGRRTIYQEVRRNFLSPMMLAFDMPQPLSTFGRRTTSNVPAQSLIMMNDPFVVEQSKLWAKRILGMGNGDNPVSYTHLTLPTKRIV